MISHHPKSESTTKQLMTYEKRLYWNSNYSFSKQRWFSGKWQKLAIFERLWKVRVTTIGDSRNFSLEHDNKNRNDLLNSLVNHVCFWLSPKLSGCGLPPGKSPPNHSLKKKHHPDLSFFPPPSIIPLAVPAPQIRTNGLFFTVEKW